MFIFVETFEYECIFSSQWILFLTPEYLCCVRPSWFVCEWRRMTKNEWKSSYECVCELLIHRGRWLHFVVIAVMMKIMTVTTCRLWKMMNSNRMNAYAYMSMSKMNWQCIYFFINFNHNQTICSRCITIVDRSFLTVTVTVTVTVGAYIVIQKFSFQMIDNCRHVN
jgi:hypothetical protein